MLITSGSGAVRTPLGQLPPASLQGSITLFSGTAASLTSTSPAGGHPIPSSALLSTVAAESDDTQPVVVGPAIP